LVDLILIAAPSRVDSPLMAIATEPTPVRETASATSSEDGGQSSEVASQEPLSRSHMQRMDALARANHIRSQRAQLKRELKAGRVSIADLLVQPPSCIDTAKVFDLLLAVPRYGRVKVNKVLAHCRISPSKTVGGLSERQRAELVTMLRR